MTPAKETNPPRSKKNLTKSKTPTNDTKCRPMVAVIGSSRWPNAHRQAEEQETLAGRIVLGAGVYPKADLEAAAEWDHESLALLSAARINQCDEVLVINLGGYIGEGTQALIGQAKALGKVVRYWENSKPRAEP